MRSWKRNLPSLFAIVGIALAALALTYALSQATTAAHQAGALATRLDREADSRVRESCVSSKARYVAAIRSLTRTYAFLEQSSPSERKSTINRFVTAGLDKQEKDAQALRPASFCRGIGPVVPPIPSRPQSLQRSP